MRDSASPIGTRQSADATAYVCLCACARVRVGGCVRAQRRRSRVWLPRYALLGSCTYSAILESATQLRARCRCRQRSRAVQWQPCVGPLLVRRRDGLLAAIASECFAAYSAQLMATANGQSSHCGGHSRSHSAAVSWRAAVNAYSQTEYSTSTVPIGCAEDRKLRCAAPV
jgi:hypothetical protein